MKISLKAARVNAKMTQAEVAEKINVARETVLRWESDPHRISATQLRKLSELYGVPTDMIDLPEYTK